MKNKIKIENLIQFKEVFKWAYEDQHYIIKDYFKGFKKDIEYN